MTLAHVDLDNPAAARITNWLLGGTDNWYPDRAFVEHALELFPPARSLALANRRWQRRVVDAALNAGITQFIDLGAGVPSVDAIHAITRRRHDLRVVYVDHEHIACIHTQRVLHEASVHPDHVISLEANLRWPGLIFDDPQLRKALDLTQPVCVLLSGVLHFVAPDVDVPGLLREYRHHLVARSRLAISHIAADAVTNPEQAAQVTAYAHAYRHTQHPMHLRDREHVTSWLRDWGPLLPPGIVHLPQWRPTNSADQADDEHDEDQGHPWSWCGVSRKARSQGRRR